MVRMSSAATRDKERAERLCMEVRQYVDMNVVRSLDDYATLLKRLSRENAGAAEARADQLRKAKQSQSKSVYLGWNPSDELRAYAALLRETGREADAAAIEVLADAHHRV